MTSSWNNPLLVGQVLTFLGVLVTAIFSMLGNKRAKSADDKSTIIHALVNSEFTKAQKIAEDALNQVAELRLIVAKLTGTPEDAVKAVVAEALAKAPPVVVGASALPPVPCPPTVEPPK